METLISSAIEWAVAELAQPGQSESGDRGIPSGFLDDALVLVVRHLRAA